ncbi:MAG TPA: SGNH/GDSL hydrolase family protein [Acidobacteriota bacterium]|nr:SGNH/GDSL hydrolase family protein [Acidobacteriota bacterium]
MKTRTIHRRTFLSTSTATVGALLPTWRSVWARPGHQEAAPEDLVWHDPESWGVEGRGWPAAEMKRFYDRLPAKAEGVVRDAVWNLSRDSAGMLIRFETDSPEIHVRYQLLRERLALPHMPATGVSGADLYGQDSVGTWRWAAVARPTDQQVAAKLLSDLDGSARGYTLYFPLYNGVDSLQIGVPRGTKFRSIAPRKEKPIVFYGTSITHGACASRPGMPHPAILGRRLNMPVINLGFSGNGRMESEVGSLLCELRSAAYVIDCLPNMDSLQVSERAEPLVRQLREAHPETPIVLVEDRTFTNAWIRSSSREHHNASRAKLREAFEHLERSGISKLHYLEGEVLLGKDSEGATDGSHPSDLGFMRQADAFEPVLRKALSLSHPSGSWTFARGSLGRGTYHEATKITKDL